AEKDMLLVTIVSAVPASYNAIKEGLIIKTDSMGNERWRLRIKNDSTTCYNLLVAPLANGNYLATYQDYYYKPYKSPNNNQWPETNKSMTIWFSEFDDSGNILRTWNLKEELKHRFPYEPQPNLHNHLVVAKDSAIIITGNTGTNGTNGHD